MDKTCGSCRRHLPQSAFSRRAASADGRQARCRDCCAADYIANREQRKASAAAAGAATLRRHRAWIAGYLAEHPCVDCGETDLRCLDFDHRDPADKLSNVCSLVGTHVRWDRVVAEIAKCDVRCANCHRKRRGEQRNDWRHQIRRVEVALDQAAVTERLQFLVQRDASGAEQPAGG